MRLLQISIRGWTATFRLPMLYSGTGLTSPVPPYSTLLGLIGSLAGREIYPNETKIGYVFQSAGTAIDRENLKRLKISEDGRLGIQPKPNNGLRQFLVHPEMELFVDNLDLRRVFEEPQNPPCLGRSQDLAWIISVSEVEGEIVESGLIRGTLVPFPQQGASGQILVLPDYFDNSKHGYTRAASKLNRYQVVKWDTPANVEGVREGKLVIVEGREESVYLHDLSKNA